MKTRRRTALIDASLEALYVLPARRQRPSQITPVCEGLVLPPYPGELGIEIRYFLARVEPWLRAGWKILARRPELYPEGSAIRNDSLAEAEEALFTRFGAVRRATGPVIMHPSKGLLNPVRATVARAKARHLQEEWRRLLRPYLGMGATRPWTRWDTALTTVSTVFSGHEIWTYGDVLPPSYLPPAFTSQDPKWSYADHVGVQFRAVAWNPDRNSNLSTVLAEARRVSEHLSLPLLVYGDPVGCSLPEATCTTASLGNGPLLSRELGYLRTCRVMLAPNSGWADLMCWLHVPVLVECRQSVTIFDMMASFEPRILLRRPELPVESQVDELLKGATALRDLGFAKVDDASLDDWVGA